MFNYFTKCFTAQKSSELEKIAKRMRNKRDDVSEALASLEVISATRYNKLFKRMRENNIMHEIFGKPYANSACTRETNELHDRVLEEPSISNSVSTDVLTTRF